MSVRLPTTVRPRHYRLTIHPQLSVFKFTGTVDITIDVSAPTSRVELHAKQLNVGSARVRSLDTSPGANWVAASSIQLEEKQEKLVLLFADALTAGSYELSIAFDGEINKHLAGFYWTSYKYNGEVKVFATTQFEATDARRAFPCWDEPSFKATFTVVLRVPRDMAAISNTQAVSVTSIPHTNLREYEFAPTPVMSTYLLAYIIGEFDSIATLTSGGVEVRVYTPLGKAPLARFALDVAKRALEYYEKLFRIPYPLSKMDLVAVPDFAAGAMENWGLITYRELALLIDEEKSTLDRKQRVARTVCHEIAHQWFGNLVTMEWWTHLWLNEGFARFLEFYAVNHIFPEWNIWTTFVSSIYEMALNQDALSATHPIEVAVNHPDEINEIFDAISYAKGASIIRMLCAHLGESVFFEGLHRYLTKHAYGNALTEDLRASMEATSGKEIKRMMGLWTALPGFPVLDIGEDLSIEQRRFRALNEKEPPGHWFAPVSLVAPGDAPGAVVTKQLGVLDEPRDAALLRDAASLPWFKLNAGQVGFYRVAYTPKQLRALHPHISALPVADRLGVLGDTLAIGQAHLVPLPSVLELLLHYKHEQDYYVWSLMAEYLAGTARLFRGAPLFGLLRAFVVDLASGIEQRLWSALAPGTGAAQATVNGQAMQQFYSLIVSLLNLVGDSASLKRTRALFAEHVSGERSVAPNMRDVVFRSAVATCPDRADYDAVLALYEHADMSEEKRMYLAALASANTPALVESYLQFLLSDAVRPQDAVLGYHSLAMASAESHKMMWSHFVSNFDVYDERFNRGGQSFLLSGVAGALISEGKTSAFADEVSAFFATHAWPAADSAIRKGVETVRFNAERSAREEAVLHDWLATRYKSVA